MENDWIERYRPVKLKYVSCSTNESEASDRSPIILVHGMFGANTSWNKVKCELSNRTRRKVYAVDLRNHGGSEYCDEFSLNHMTSDLLQFMTDLKIPRAILIGQSIGGRVCMQLALQKPEMVERLVVEDMSISDAPDEKRIILKKLLSTLQTVVTQLPIYMSLNDAHGMITRILQKYMTEFSKNGETSGLERALPIRKNESSGAFEFSCNMDVLLKSLDSVHRYRVDLSGQPVYLDKALFLSGQHSIIPVEKDKDLILKYFPSATFSMVEGGYHCTHAECPSEFISIVMDFLAS